MREVLEEIRARAGDCARRAAWPLSDQDLTDCLHSVHQIRQQLAAVTAHLVREIQGRDLPRRQQAANPTVWLRDHLHISVRQARELTALAEMLDHRPALDTALADGTVGVEQVTTIAQAINALPDDLDQDATDQAETLLIGYAAQFEPAALRRLGSRILAHVDPDAADRADAAALERDHARAHNTRTLTLHPLGAGAVRLSGRLDTEAAAVVTAALDPLCRPLPADTRTAGQRRADALTEVCHLALRTDTLPDNGGARPHLVVTVGYHPLSQQLGTGHLDNGDYLTPEQIRRLACDAHLIPAVLGAQGQPLDLGRSRRLFTGPLRRALILRDKGCAFPACDRPPTWCDAHHIVPWTDGGTTSLDNGVLLCGFHHRLIHHSDWTVHLGPDHRPEFLPPAHLDPQRRPQRNVYHHPDPTPPTTNIPQRLNDAKDLTAKDLTANEPDDASRTVSEHGRNDTTRPSTAQPRSASISRREPAAPVTDPPNRPSTQPTQHGQRHIGRRRGRRRRTFHPRT